MKVLYLLDEWPEPANSGAKVHDKIMLRCLTEDWQADVACWSKTGELPIETSISPMRIFSRASQSWRSLPWAVIKLFLKRVPLHTSEFLSSDTQEQLRELVLSVSPKVIVISAPRLAVIVPFIDSASSAKIVVDTHDVHVQRCQSIYDALPSNEVVERIKQKLLTYTYGIIEKHIYKRISVAWVLKKEDKLLLESFGSVPRVDIVPNVVDPDLVRDLSESSGGDIGDRVSCVFIGDYSYKPNEQCALMLIEWFGLDRVKATDVTLYLIGVNPSTAMMRRGELADNVCVTGEVADLRDYYKPIDTIFLAPLLAGGGVKRKVIEAMACGCPVITTEVGAEGLELVDGVTAEICPVKSFPEKIVALASDRRRRTKLAEIGQEHIGANFSYSTLRAAVRASFENILGDTVN